LVLLSFFGLLVVAATASGLSDLSWWVTAALVFLALAALGAWDRATLQSVLVAKEQDRRYFLACAKLKPSMN
jgi:hypothetical protein